MPNKRSADQTVITVSLSGVLRDVVNEASGKLAGGRSQFIRDAIQKKLHAMGFRVPVESILAPPRTRGEKRKSSGGTMLNDAPSPKNSKPQQRKEVKYPKPRRSK